MKLLRLLPALAFLLNPLLQAADAPARSTPDLSKYKTADDLWQYLRESQEEPTTPAKSREEALMIMAQWLESQRVAAETFAEKYPTDPRRWQARLLALRVTSKWREFTGQPVLNPSDRKLIDEIQAAPDAPIPVKGEAAYFGVMLLTTAFDRTEPESFAAFYRAVADYLEKYPDHPLALQTKGIQLQVLAQDPTSAGAELLQKLATGPDPRIAAPAQEIIRRKQRLIDLKSKPIDLKYTAADGREVDLAKLRGKVVLLDFWATWCPPCMAELPHLVETYERLHSKGFEIAGVSLDQDKETMDPVLKAHQATWPQFIDGLSYKGRITSEFGVDRLPTTWLIDKKGMLRERDLRGEELTAAIEKLLAE